MNTLKERYSDLGIAALNHDEKYKKITCNDNDDNIKIPTYKALIYPISMDKASEKAYHKIYHMLIIKDIDKVDILKQCPICGTYINRSIGSHHSYKEHVEHCEFKERLRMEKKIEESFIKKHERKPTDEELNIRLNVTGYEFLVDNEYIQLAPEIK